MSRLRYLTAGESHGEMLVGILEGMPAGLSLLASRDIDPWLKARQGGYGRGRRQQIENDAAHIVSGVRFGVTTGAPIAVTIQNRDWQSWQERMAVEASSGQSSAPVTIPRPGHADLAGALKYGLEDDLRNVFERASARETAIRVALGAIAQKLLSECGVETLSFVRSIGSIEAAEVSEAEYWQRRETLATSPVRTFDPQAEQRMIDLIDRAREQGDTLGGVVECRLRGVPPGIGSHVHWDRKLDALFAEALMSIQAVKAVSVGGGFDAASKHGSEVHDEILLEETRIVRGSNNAGGIEGGMSNGETIVLRAAMKPISTLMKPLHSVDLKTNDPAKAHIERSDVCAVPALSIIVEAVAALTLADAMLDTFGGDTLEELRERVQVRRAKLDRGRV